MTERGKDRPTGDEIRRRRRSFLIVFAIMTLLFATPAMQVLATEVHLGYYIGDPYPFNKDRGNGTHLMPGDTIAWQVNYNGGGQGYQVHYLVGDTTFNRNEQDTTTYCGYTNRYTVLSLPEVIPGDSRRLAYWELKSVTVENDYSTRVTGITLEAHFEDAPPEAAAPPAHEHELSWVETREATEDRAGELCYMCSCGYVESRVATSANAVFMDHMTDKVKNAPYGSTLEISTTRWKSFNRAFCEAFDQRPDLSMKLTFRQFGYRGDRFQTLIPAGAGLTSYLDENGYVGFNYLAANFGAVRVP